MSLVEGVGSEDNDKFEIINTTLVTKAMFNYEAKALLSIRVRIQDSQTNFEKVYVVRIQDAHEHPTNIWLSKTEIISANTIIGEFIANDEDSKETFIFTLVAGQGDDDNNLFQITQNYLKISSISKNSFKIRVQV